MQEVQTVKNLIERGDKKKLNNIFSLKEQAYCSDKKTKYEHYAARLAVKNAFLKAFGKKNKGGQRLNGIEVLNAKNGRPFLNLTKQVKRAFAITDILQIEISLTHERTFAMGNVIAVIGK